METNKKLYIIGAGGHGKVVADIAKKNGYTDIQFLDDGVKGNIGNYSIVGTSQDIQKLHSINKEADFFIAIGSNIIREKIFNQLKKYGVTPPVLKHPTSVIDETVQIGEGTVVMANVVMNASTVIGKGSIINTASTIDHDCCIDDFVHISPGVHVAGTVHIGKKSWLGIGSTVINNVHICDDVIVGAGSVVVKNIECSNTYMGIPAKRKDGI